MSDLHLVPLGVGDAFSALYYSSCLALEVDGAWLLIDCPHPIRKMMREAAATAGVHLDVEAISAVAVTHLHADHSSGLEGLGYYSHVRLHRRVQLLAHPEVTARLWQDRLAPGMDQVTTRAEEPALARRLDDYFNVIPLSESHPVQIGPFAVECRRTIHSVPTTAVRVRAAGRCIGYSADTAFDPTLIAWLAPADLVVHETNLGPHTPYEKLADLPDALRRKMRLIHYPDNFDLQASVIEPLEQGRRYTV